MLGLRRSEASQIRAGDLEYLDGQWIVRIHGKGDRERALPLAPRLARSWSLWFGRLSEEAPLVAFEESPVAWIDWCRRNAVQPLLVSPRAKTREVAISPSEIARIVRKLERQNRVA